MNDVKLKVLYVDDEPINTTLFKINFKKYFDIVLAPSGDAALEILETETNVDVMVSDFRMPGLNGVEFIRKAHDQFGVKPAIILTGFDSNEEIDKAMKEGIVSALLNKPIDKDHVHETILRCYKKGA